VEEVQASEGTHSSVLRLPASLSWRERAWRAKAWISEFQPDWVSLQFVPFGFQKKGLPFGLIRVVDGIAGAAKRHVMFHELWLGSAKGSSFKHRAWGGLQRVIILRLLRHIRPLVIHTQATPYQALLGSVGYSGVRLLPLFGNIPVVGKPVAGPSALERKLREQLGVGYDRAHVCIGAIFGAIHPEWNAKENAEVLARVAGREGRRLVMVFLGRSHYGPEQWRTLRETLGRHAEVVTLGELPPDEISRTLQEADIGLATSPLGLIEKSGSAAAMREHGLPVIYSRDDIAWRVKEAAVASSRVTEWTSLQRIRTSERLAPENYSHSKSLEEVTMEFVASLKPRPK
jgi:hypothetical protein